MIELKGETNPVDIAKRELEEGKMPLLIKLKEKNLFFEKFWKSFDFKWWGGGHNH